MDETVLEKKSKFKIFHSLSTKKQNKKLSESFLSYNVDDVQF